MKLPSIQQVLQESNRTLQRFPVVIASVVVGTLSALALVDYDTRATEQHSSLTYWWQQYLGFPSCWQSHCSRRAESGPDGAVSVLSRLA